MYQEQFNLSSKDILEKEFKIDTRGYRLKEVDQFLDLIISDYETFFKIIKEKDFVRPFIRKVEATEITKLGDRDYQKLDQYIVASLNDYYSRLMSANEEERKVMLNIYRRLYSMWQELHNFKISKNLPEIDKMYDLFSYELYVLGYIN